jgi:ElaB/YqjD/DUF883 family membrane-anchored ribosome-binding protein
MLKKNGETVVEKIKDLTETELPKVQESYVQTRQKAEEEIRQALDHYGPKLQDAGRTFGKQASRVAGSTRDMVRQYPWQSAMVTLTFLGLLAGFFVKSRRQQSGNAIMDAISQIHYD